MLLSAMGVMGQAHSHFLTQPDTHLWLALLDCLALDKRPCSPLAGRSQVWLLALLRRNINPHEHFSLQTSGLWGVISRLPGVNIRISTVQSRREDLSQPSLVKRKPRKAEGLFLFVRQAGVIVSGASGLSGPGTAGGGIPFSKKVP